ncbi:DUF805 domain-containing protein [Xanthocytophaga agilis]|uniref:DUF805 domain-containing protein n=1 Tax=Xanthocytophaga agilis TaxID=3048010 RepID=A0AAE3UC41_9BACT|nr:DUF805 domain-containing protein [Xanthocytophaga agilis]MDJ1500518.1 DUF805 domain-containing protein [Xanthocytophaga agilis]
MFQNIFSFEGRIRRLEYGLTRILVLLGCALIGGLSEAAGGIVLILLIPAIWILLAQSVKRCHDLGNSGFFILIPFYGLFLLFADGTYGTNEYGANPKGVGEFNPNVDYTA